MRLNADPISITLRTLYVLLIRIHRLGYAIRGIASWTEVISL